MIISWVHQSAGHRQSGHDRCAFLRISRKYEHKPLIIPTIYKAVLFTIWVMVFDIIEIYIKAFIKTPDLAEAFKGLLHHINPAWFGAAVVICISFLPFFAMKELSRVMGADNFRGMFFKNRSELQGEIKK